MAFATLAPRVAWRQALVLPTNDSLCTSDEALKTALMYAFRAVIYAPIDGAPAVSHMHVDMKS